MRDVVEIVRELAGRRGTLLVALQEIQGEWGFVPEEAIGVVAQGYRVEEGEVREVISFYSELRTKAPGRHRVCVCRGDSCAAKGAGEVGRAAEAHLGVGPGGTTGDGQFTYDVVYCLGNCALSPSVAIDGEVCGRLTAERAVQRLKEVEGG